MGAFSVEEFVDSYAPVDVQDTVTWLLSNDYALVSQQGVGPFGASFVFAGKAEVRISVDRSQWVLDVARRPGSEPWQYDLLVAAYRGQDYGERFPGIGSRSFPTSLPEQLPDGVSWRQTLPDVLRWIMGDGVEEAVVTAQRQRNALMWPRSRKS